MRCLAHRGFAGVAPENTLPAVNGAVAAGADGIEADVRRCGTGELVVVHDETVDRVTDGSGRVADHSLAELAALDVLGSGAGIPPLVDVLAAVPADTMLNVELKETGLVDDLAAAVGGADADVLVSSFEEAALEPVHERTDLPTALLRAEPGDAVDRAVSLGCRALHPYHSWCDDALVGTAHDAGLAVNAWTVQDDETADRLAEVGVDGLIADSPVLCR
jgi:glycerophosphoryl diester phosphodiesterase